MAKRRNMFQGGGYLNGGLGFLGETMTQTDINNVCMTAYSQHNDPNRMARCMAGDPAELPAQKAAVAPPKVVATGSVVTVKRVAIGLGVVAGAFLLWKLVFSKKPTMKNPGPARKKAKRKAKRKSTKKAATKLLTTTAKPKRKRSRKAKKVVEKASAPKKRKAAVAKKATKKATKKAAVKEKAAKKVAKKAPRRAKRRTAKKPAAKKASPKKKAGKRKAPASFPKGKGWSNALKEAWDLQKAGKISKKQVMAQARSIYGK